MEHDENLCVCPKCGKTAWVKVIEGVEYYYCPFCGGHGKLVNPADDDKNKIEE